MVDMNYCMDFLVPDVRFVGLIEKNIVVNVTANVGDGTEVVRICSVMGRAGTIGELEFGMYPQSMPTEWTHAQRKPTPRSQGFLGQSSSKLAQV